MDLRIKNLTALDDRSVPLPHGTEVVTRVERLFGERRVPQGTIGRVSKQEGEAIEVAIVGVGVVRYARAELLPRRVGQMLFAARREDAWSALRSCVVLEATVGSRAWGLAEATSDEDKRGVFAHPLPWTQGLVPPPEDLVSADGSATYWSAIKAIRQALRADPNTLEMLFLPNARALDPIGTWILEAKDAFVSAEIYGTFGRYAIGQLRRLEQGTRLAEHRTVVLEWLRKDPTLTMDATATLLAEAVRKPELTAVERVHQAKQYVKQLYRSLADQGLLEANDFASLVRFARDASQDFDLPRELRPKNAYNLLRLMHTATHWLVHGTPVFEMSGSFRDRLFAIKRGEVALEDVLAEAEAMGPALEHARASTTLPARPDVARADALVRRIGGELAQRWVQQSPGPLGCDAPAPPIAAWAESESAPEPQSENA